MIQTNKLVDIIDMTYEAVLDPELWPSVLTKLADAMGAAQVAMATLDQRDLSFDCVAPRTDPDQVASYCGYWAFNNPLWAPSTLLRVGDVFTLDQLMPRGEFSKTPVCNEWWTPSGFGLAMLGANLVVEKGLSALLVVANAPRKDELEIDQSHVFKTTLRHINRAVRIHRRLWNLDLDRDSNVARFENAQEAVFLVDGAGRVLFQNRAAEELLGFSQVLALKGGILSTKDGSATLHGLIASCRHGADNMSLSRVGGEFRIARGHLAPVHVTVTPFRAKDARLAVPWLGLHEPAAMVTVIDPEHVRRRLERHLRDTFGLTPAESGLATEIAKGDGRQAAAQRRGITVSTARAQLSSIFDKTGTRRQAELVRLVQEISARRDARG